MPLKMRCQRKANNRAFPSKQYNNYSLLFCAICLESFAKCSRGVGKTSTDINFAQ